VITEFTAEKFLALFCVFNEWGMATNPTLCTFQQLIIGACIQALYIATRGVGHDMYITYEHEMNTVQVLKIFHLSK